MASAKKRVADTYLTHDNWDREDDSEEPEEAGVFKPANEDILSKRNIRKAKRRGGAKDSSATGVAVEEKGSVPSNNPFAKFGGFGDAASTISFGAKPITTIKPLAPVSTSDTNKENKVTNNFWGSVSKSEEQKKDFFATRTATDSSKVEPFSQFTKLSSGTPEKSAESIIKNDTNNNNKNETKKKRDMAEGKEEFHKELCQLNVCVLNWIKTHVDENPCIDLQPVFRDYEKHMKDLEGKHNIKRGSNEEVKNGSVKKSEPSIFKTPDNNASPIVAPTASSGSSTFSMMKSSTPIPAAPFGDSLKTSNLFSTQTTNTNLFSTQTSNTNLFNTASPFSFKPTSSTVIPETVQEEANEDEAPEPERKTVVESDAFHQIRCKLFFKKGSEWKELGIGMLYLKPGADDGKVQLLVRMETSTGKVLLNVTVTKETPTSRSGKNNLMVVTIPNPPVFSKAAEGDNSLPCTYLIRVKGTTEADELLGKLKK